MQMNDFEQELLTQAARELWFDPHDDRHVTLIPVRFNRLRGSRARINLGYTDHYLPDTHSPYVVYGLGQVSTALLGFEERRNALLNWTRLDTLSRSNEMVINVHINQRMLPLSSVYLRRNERMQLTLAVNARVNGGLLETGAPLCVRLFSSDWAAEHAQEVADPMEELSVLIERPEDAGAIINRWRTVETGNKLLFHNGYYVNDITGKELHPGDTLALQVDKTGLGYLDFPLNDLPHFFSERDQRGKWLVQLNLPDRTQPVPADELDIFVVDRQADAGAYRRYKGFYYSRLNDEDVRQITHQDFALDSRRLEALVTEHRSEMALGDPFLRVFLRATTERPKQFPQVDGQCTLDLYRVGLEERTSLMVGANSTYSPWNASALELSPYVRWQNSEVPRLTGETLRGTYAWAEVNRRVLEGYAPTDRLTPDAATGEKHYRLPYLAAIGCMALGYDASGTLIHRQSVPAGAYNTHLLMPAAVTQVRCLPGNAQSSPSTFDRDTDFIDQADWFAEQLYWRSASTEQWQVAREGDDYETDRETGRRVWLDKHGEHGRMRRTIRDSSVRDLTVQVEMLHHPIGLFETSGPWAPMPLSHTEVYLDGHFLVEGVDFTLQYPYVWLHAKAYHLGRSVNTVRVEIFHYGLPDQPTAWGEFGFVRNRRMVDGDSTRYSDLRHHTLVVDGKLSRVDQWDLTERPEQVMADAIREGALYHRKCAVATLSGWAKDRLGLEEDHDKSAMAVTSRFLERPAPTAPVFIPHAHAIFSPFVYRTVQRIRSGEIDVATIGLSRGGAVTAMQKYLPELDVDVLSTEMDWKMVDVHPAPANEQVEITEDEFLFLRLLNELYFHKRLVFNTYFNVTRNLT